MIVAEGFDTGHITDPEGQFGDNDIERGFFREVRKSSALTNLLLNNPQYDIVYVDWKRGTDNIKKNAQLLKEVIRRVNTLKAAANSTAKNVIIGQSMGGLVTRWALKEMENAGENHQTNLFFSYDTPHQGANLPLAYQHLVKHLKKLYIRAFPISTPVEVFQLISGGVRPTSLFNLTSTSAARQMLVNFVDDNNDIDNEVHNQWQVELKNMGYPQGFNGSPLRIVAVSNGTECANPQPSSEGSSFLSYVGKGNTRFLGDLAGMVAFPVLGLYSVQPSFLMGVLPGKNTINIEVQLNATSTGGGNRVYYNKVTFTKKILWLIPVTVNVTNKSYNAPSGDLAYDAYPGGSFEVPIKLTSSEASNLLFKYNISVTQQPVFGFVPVTSALDIGRGNIALTAADYTTKYIGASPPTGSKSSPFANFITAFNPGSSVNESHLTISSRNGNWVAAELNKASLGTGNLPVATNCTYMCNDVVITGPDLVCTNATYSIPNVPIGVTIQWSTTGGIVINGAANSNQVSISSASNSSSANGIATLSVTTSASCGSLFKTKNITVNNPNAWFTNQIDYYGLYLSIPAQTGFTYQWRLNGVLVSTTNNYRIPYPSCGSGANTWFPIQLTVTNACGATGVSNQYYTYDCYPTSGFRFVYSTDGSSGLRIANDSNYSFYPNPANTQLTISAAPTTSKNSDVAKSETLQTSDNKQFEVVLYDDKGKKIAQQKNDTQNKDIEINTQDIPNGRANAFNFAIRIKNILT